MTVGSAVISAGIEAEDYSSASSNVSADSGTVTANSVMHASIDQAAIQGSKGGSSKTHTPVEAANSLRSIEYFRILDLIAEGEVVGLVNGLQSVYLNKTPVAASDGSLNFQNVSVVQRLGTQDQDYIQGFSAVENEISVGTELTSSQPWTIGLSNTELSAVRITLNVESLEKQNTSNGDITGYEVAYHIDVSTDGGAY
jgi:predicted phage tail protein